MAYNSKAIKTDVNAKPIPQYYNPTIDEYEVLQGTGGAARQVLYGPDGQPISTTEGKLAVRAAELEAKLEAVRVLLNSLAGEDFATSAKQAEMLAALGNQSTAAKQDALAALVGAIDAAAVSDPAASGTVISLLKGLLSQLQAGSPVSVTESNLPTGAATDAEIKNLQAKVDTLNAKLDAITDGTTPATTQLMGSLMQEYSFNDIPITAGATLVRYFNFTGNIEGIVINIGVAQSLTQKLSPKHMFNLARYGYTATNMLIPIPAHVDTVKGFVSTKFDVLGSKMRVDITNPETETDIDVNIAIRAFIRGSAENANVLMTTS